VARVAAPLGDWLDSPHLVVGVHDADEHRPRPNRLAYVIGIDTAKAIDRRDTHVEAQLLQKSARSNDCRMLDGDDDDVDASRLERPGYPLKSQGVSLGAGHW